MSLLITSSYIIFYKLYTSVVGISKVAKEDQTSLIEAMMLLVVFGTLAFPSQDPFSPNRFTCEGFLLLLRGCMLGPDDFEFVSGLVFLAA